MPDITFNVDYTIEALPINSLNLIQLYYALNRNLVMSVNTDSIMRCRQDLTLETGDTSAPYFDGQGWFYKDQNAWTPVKARIGDVVLAATPTSNKSVYVQNKTGTIALLDDAYHKDATLTLTDGVVNVDWSKARQFYVNVTRNTGFFMTNSTDGQEIRIFYRSTYANTLVWDAGIMWPGGLPPTGGAGGPGGGSFNAGDSLGKIITLRNFNGTIYGDYVALEAL